MDLGSPKFRLKRQGAVNSKLKSVPKAKPDPKPQTKIQEQAKTETPETLSTTLENVVSKRVPVYKQLASLPKDETEETDVYDIPTDSLPSAKKVRRRQPKRKAENDPTTRKRFKRSPTQKQKNDTKKPKNVQKPKKLAKRAEKNTQNVSKGDTRPEEKSPKNNATQIPELGDHGNDFASESAEAIVSSNESKSENVDKNYSTKQRLNKNSNSVEQNSNKNESQKVYSTPSIPRRLYSRALELGKISTPRSESSSLMSKEMRQENEKLQNFGFDDDYDDVINSSSLNDLDLFSPIRITNNLSPHSFSTPLPGNPQNSGVRPHRFNLGLNRSIIVQNVSYVDCGISPCVEINKNTEKVTSNSTKIVKSGFAIIKEEPKEGQDKEGIKSVLFSLEDLLESSEKLSESAERLVDSKENLPAEQIEQKLQKKEVKNSCQIQPTILSFFAKDSQAKLRNKQKSCSEYLTSPETVSSKRGRASKTYQRSSFINLHAGDKPQISDESEDEDPETSEWKKIQTSHFSEIDDTCLEFA